MASFIPRALLAKLTSKGGDSSDSAPRRRSRTIVVPRGFGHGVPGMIESYAVGRELGRVHLHCAKRVWEFQAAPVEQPQAAPVDLREFHELCLLSRRAFAW